MQECPNVKIEYSFNAYIMNKLDLTASVIDLNVKMRFCSRNFIPCNTFINLIFLMGHA